MLIHAAAGGSGSAAIQLAVNAGARVFATAGTEAKLRCAASSAPTSRSTTTTSDFAEVVLEETGNRGVDVVFDNVGEAVMAKSLDCLAYNGRYLMMGFASNKAVADEKFLVPRRLMAGNMKLCGVLLAYAPEAAAKLLKKGMGWNFVPNERGASITAEIVAQVLAKKLRPVVGGVVAFEEIPAAIEAMASRQTVGRTIVKLY